MIRLLLSLHGPEDLRSSQVGNNRAASIMSEYSTVPYLAFRLLCNPYMLSCDGVLSAWVTLGGGCDLYRRTVISEGTLRCNVPHRTTLARIDAGDEDIDVKIPEFGCDRQGLTTCAHL